MIFLRKFFLLPLLIVAVVSGHSQTTVVKDSAFISGTTVIIAGQEYQRSGYHNFWWGRHNRKEWTTAVRVNNFDLDQEGLVPVKESGSRQSRGLRLKNKAGKEFVLRAVDKDFGNGLPDIFHGTFISHIAKDQASIGYPYAAVSITPMIKAVGIYHTNPRIVFVPKQSALGSYNDKYGDQLYLFEERADENQEDADYFGNSKNVIGTAKLFEKLYDDNDNQVDQKAFAKARLFDMVIGDWGRHPDQWRWAKIEEGNINVYRPVPRDRDQAYTTIDGFWPGLAASVPNFRFLQGFRYDIKNVRRFNIPGRPLDRRFTNELTEADWVNVAKEVQHDLTDEVIEYSVRQLPAEIYAISGSTVVAKLKSRRDHLQEYARAYYDYLSNHVDLLGSNEREFFDIKTLSKNETQIDVYKIRSNGEIAKQPYYSKLFRHNETKELRLYGLEKRDIIKVSGVQGRGTMIRVIDPQREDSIIVSAPKRVKISRGRQFEFDTAEQKKFDMSIVPLASPPEYKIFEDDPISLFTKTGARVSLNMKYYPEPWRKAEYEHEHLISANYGFLRGAFNVGYVGRFGQAVGTWDFLLKARLDAPAVENYFGTGNETVIANTKTNFYRTHSSRLLAGFGIDNASGNNYTSISAIYQHINIKRTGGHYIDENNVDLDPDQLITKSFAGVEAGYDYKNVNDTRVPTKGVHFQLGAGYLTDLTDRSRSFGTAQSSLSFYLPLPASFSLAIRGGGGTTTGTVDYYHLQKLGGYINLRGYQRERFYGRSMAYNNNELRWLVNTRNYIFNGQIGLLAFYDEGRVWQPGEHSNTWHTGYGGGIILVPFNKIALTATYGISAEDKVLQLKAGMFF
jgi:hypothetical protein